jgi:hypothetical protein
MLFAGGGTVSRSEAVDLAMRNLRFDLALVMLGMTVAKTTL